MLNKKILLSIMPPFWPKMPPLGIGYLQAYLAGKNIKADILDLNNIFYNLAGANSRSPLQKSWLVSCNTFLEENMASIIQSDFPFEFNAYINKILEYDIVGFSCFKSNFKTTLEIVKILKEKKKDIKIILGGPEIARQYFKTNGKFNVRANDYPPAGRAGSPLQADLIVVGEGEKPLYDFLVGARCNVPLPNQNKISQFSQLKNLDDLPFPKFGGLNIKAYPRNDAIPLLFSRGCVRKCNFCSEKLLYIGFRTRPVEKLIEEIGYHLTNNIKYFVFFDSMLNADLKKFEKLCDAVIADFGSINWEAQIAVRKDMDEALFEKIKKSGCYNLFIGLESGSDNTLKKMNKGFTCNDAVEFFKKLNNAGLFFGISLITGYPGETEKDFQESLDFVIKNKDLIPKIEQINPFTYYDGTDTDGSRDYKLNPDSIKKMEIFIEEIKKYNFKYTNAFLGNLVEKIQPPFVPPYQGDLIHSPDKGRQGGVMIEINEVKIQRILNPTAIDLGEYVINPFMGCEFACLYCYVRSNRVISKRNKPWGEYVDVRINAPELLEKELELKKPKVVLLGSTTECFQPTEQKYQITKKVLEILNNHGVFYVILTRSPYIVNYIPLLNKGFCRNIYFTINNIPTAFKQKLEPNTPGFDSRIEAVNMLIDEKIPVTPYFSPVLPWISDYNDIFTKLEKSNSVEFECLNFNLNNISDIIDKINEIDHFIGEKYKKLFNDKDFYSYIMDEVKKDITKKAISAKKSFNVHIHSFGNYFENRYS